MDKAAAITALGSTSTFERLKGARHLNRSAEPSDLATLRKHRATEQDAYVRAALDRAIGSISSPAVSLTQLAAPDNEVQVSEEVRRALLAQATREVAGILLHEISSPIGLVERAAQREVPNYDVSRTKQRIQIVQRVFEAIVDLNTAATPSRPESVDLPTFVEEIISQEPNTEEGLVSKHGPTPLVVTTDSRLLRLALSNGLRNALEAVRGLSRDHQPIVISWGATDSDVWITVVDSGTGLTSSAERVFEIGRTTKAGHRGFGLAIARQAMDSLRGTVVLTSATTGGVCYELRWER